MKDKEIQEKEEINLKLQNNKKVQKLKEKGITLVALVVTIIILLILVGVTIAFSSGENGLINRAKEAVERYKNVSEEEQVQLGQLGQYESNFENLNENITTDRILIQMGAAETYGAVFNVSCFSKILVTEGSAHGRVYDVDFDEHRYTSTTYWPEIYPKTGVIYNIKEEHPEAKSFYLTGKFIAYLIK